MKRSLSSYLRVMLVTAAVAGAAFVTYVSSSAIRADDNGKSAFAPGHQSSEPSAVGTWFGVARPCQVDLGGGDAGHFDFCQKVCDLCPFIPGTLPPEVPMMPTVHADGTVTVNDAGSIPVFHTTAQGAWAPDPDPQQPQFHGKTRYQASFIWLQGSPDQVVGAGVNRQFVGVARPRFVVYFDPKNPDNMIGYIQPYFFPIVGANGAVNVLQPPQSKGNLDVTNHYPALDFLAQLPKECTPAVGCLGTFHFTIHRVKANVPN